VIAGLIAIGGLLVYHFGVHHIHNPRPLGGTNIDISRSPGVQTQTAIAIAPGDPRLLVEAADDDVVSVSTDGGRTWTRTNGPDAAVGACQHKTPRVAVDRAGREYIAFLSGRFCGDDLTPYLVVGERSSPGARWRLTRVTRPAWSYGYDDGPALAVGGDGTVDVAFQRSTSALRSTTFVSRSVDQGRTWSRQVEISASLVQPHLASIAVAGRRVYVAGIAAKLGVWVARSDDGGRSFGPPRSVARLAQNPAPTCSLAGFSPVPHEETQCTGPDPTVLVRGHEVAVVYADGGANGAGDVFVTLLGTNLRPRYHGQVNPPDGGSPSRQFMPTAALDAATGVLWACWYDEAYGDTSHVWFTCSASRDGELWSPPERAASVPSDGGALLGDGSQFGFYPAVAAAHGAAHPAWIDTRRPELLEDVFTTTLSERAALQG